LKGGKAWRPHLEGQLPPPTLVFLEKGPPRPPPGVAITHREPRGSVRTEQRHFRKRSVGSLVHGAATARMPSEYNTAYRGRDPTKLALSKIFPAEITTLLCTKAPASEVKMVGMALMMLVTQEDVSQGVQVTAATLDTWWCKWMEWVTDLGGAHQWLSNLWHFSLKMVPFVNAVRATQVLDMGSAKAAQAVDAKLRTFYPVAGHLLAWVQAVCAEAATRGSDVQPERRLQKALAKGVTLPKEGGRAPAETVIGNELTGGKEGGGKMLNAEGICVIDEEEEQHYSTDSECADEGADEDAAGVADGDADGDAHGDAHGYAHGYADGHADGNARLSTWLACPTRLCHGLRCHGLRAATRMEPRRGTQSARGTSWAAAATLG